jgi:cytochrome c oxidase subunit II
MNIRNIVTHAMLVTALSGPSMAGRSTLHEIRIDEQVVRISASAFQFQPSAISVKKGVPVTLELVSEDRHHGFKLAAFHVRAEVKPGLVERIRFVPDKAGKFTFICDVFCGDGHEEMSGTLIVIE